MLTVLAYAMVIVFMALIMSKRLSALIALILVPIAFGLLGGFGAELGPMMQAGIVKLAPTGVMLAFAILYFGVMIDAGLFDPLVRKILRLVKGDPVKIVMGTTLLAMMISLDGDGATTYILTVTAMLPLYKRLGMNRLVLACVIMLSGGVFNILPWGGPTARAASALGVDAHEVFVPMIPSMVVSAIWVMFVSWMLGMRERRRLGTIDLHDFDPVSARSAENLAEGDRPATARPKLLWFNLGLTIALLVALVLGVLPLAVLFMVAFAIAIMVNYPRLDEQRDLLARHAENVLPVITLIFAAGVFVGVLSGTKMVDAIAASVVSMLPDAMGPYLAVVTGLLSIPFTFFISNDAFYFGIVPILAKAASLYGIAPVEIARASLIGQPVHLLSPLVASTYLLVALSEVEFGDHQRFTLFWSFTTSLVMLASAILFGVVPLVGG
ncbi:MAG TPA: CitMHS family transporter [Burkholderiaceae bacterium]|nr:CitMHS family transporter [Burkholderiaceae bacterium]